MDGRLREAAHDGNIERLYELIREDPSILEHNIDDKLFADNPLHVAASKGNHHFAAEVMRVKPSYARKLNLDGLSPIHVALQNGHDRMVEWFVSVDSNLVRDKGGKGIMTSLHYVISQENVNLLRLFLLACPDSIEDLTTKRETAMHIAIRHYNPRIFEALLGWLNKVDKEDILNWPDEDGNTVLHMATSNNQIEAVKLLLSKKWIKKINVNAKNNMGSTALDILPQLNNIVIEDMLIRAKALSGESIKNDPLEEIQNMSRKEKLEKYFGVGTRKKLADKDMSQAVLTVAVLIATATFQAVLSPPGGLWQEDDIIGGFVPASNATADAGMTYQPPHIVGTSTMTPFQFFAFYLLNSVTFYATMSIIYLHTEHLFLLNLSQIFLCATYCCSLIFISPIIGNIHLLNKLYDFIIVVTQMLFFVLAFPDICHLQKYSIRLAELIIVPYTSGENIIPYVVFFRVVPFVLIFLVFTSTFFIGSSSWWYSW